MRAALGPVEVQDQLGEAVDHARLLVEARRGIHHAEDARPRTHAVEIAERALEAAENRERREARGVLALLERDLAAYLAERPGEATVGILRPVPRDVGARAEHAHEPKR